MLWLTSKTNTAVAGRGPFSPNQPATARGRNLRLCQREAEGGQHGHAQGQQKQVLQPHPTAVDFLLLAQEAEGRERQAARLLTHHQMHKNGDAQKRQAAQEIDVEECHASAVRGWPNHAPG